MELILWAPAISPLCRNRTLIDFNDTDSDLFTTGFPCRQGGAFLAISTAVWKPEVGGRIYCSRSRVMIMHLGEHFVFSLSYGFSFPTGIVFVLHQRYFQIETMMFSELVDVSLRPRSLINAWFSDQPEKCICFAKKWEKFLSWMK